MLAAGVGARRGWNWVLRAASFRIEASVGGRPATGIATAFPSAGSALVNLLAGLARPAHGELRVLGEDLTTPRGRAAVRRRVGVWHRASPPMAGFRVRGLVEHAARTAGLTGHDRDLLTAAILDRLSLTPWAAVPLWSAPEAVGRRAGLAAAAVHEPDLLLLDGLLDKLGPREASSVADGVRELGRDAAIIVTGCDTAALRLACDDVLTLADGVLVSPGAIPGQVTRSTARDTFPGARRPVTR